MRVIYPGPSAAVTILATGQQAERGKPVDVPAKAGRNLVAQGWEKPSRPKPGGKPAKKTSGDPPAESNPEEKN